jgi:hypothetical protein
MLVLLVAVEVVQEMEIQLLHTQAEQELMAAEVAAEMLGHLLISQQLQALAVLEQLIVAAVAAVAAQH